MPSLTLAEDADLFTPNVGGQADFLDDYTHRYIALAGGWYAGKTWVGARKLVNLHLLNAVNPRTGRLTAVASLVVGPTYQALETINRPELEAVLNEVGAAWRFRGDKTKYWYELPDLGTRAKPSLIYLRTADAPRLITGFTVGSVWGDETARWKDDVDEPVNDPFLQCDGRLRDPAATCQQFLNTFTHEGDVTGVFRRFEEEPTPDHKLYRAGTSENPHAEGFERAMRKNLGVELARQYLDGQAVRIAGNLMYSAFGPANINNDQALDLNLPLQLRVDFNSNPGMHGMLGQHDRLRNVVSTVYEMFAPRMDIGQMVEALRGLCGRIGWKWLYPLEIFGDATGSARLAIGQSYHDALIEALKIAAIPYTWKIPARNPAVQDRVNAVNYALVGLDGTHRYFINGMNCPRLVDDLKRMKWDKFGEPEKKDKELSHASDADGYAIHWLMPIRRPDCAGGRMTTGTRK